MRGGKREPPLRAGKTGGGRAGRAATGPQPVEPLGLAQPLRRPVAVLAVWYAPHLAARPRAWVSGAGAARAARKKKAGFRP